MAAVKAAKEIMRGMAVRVLQKKPALKVSHFLTNVSLALREFGTKQIHQLPRAPLAVYTYAMKADRI